MDNLKQRIQEEFKNYQNDSGAWEWISTPPVNNSDLDVWYETISSHFEKNILIHIQGEESLVEIFPSQFIWDQDSDYRSGITDDRMYHVTYGKMGTGYFCITNQNVYIYVFSNLTKYYPVKEQDFITKTLLGILSGMLGQQNRVRHSHKDHGWVIPLHSILDIQIIQPENSAECLTLITNAMTWDMYAGGTEQLLHAQTAIIMAKENKLSSSTGQNRQQQSIKQPDEIARLQKIKLMVESGLITQQEYQNKKKEILSGI